MRVSVLVEQLRSVLGEIGVGIDSEVGSTANSTWHVKNGKFVRIDWLTMPTPEQIATATGIINEHADSDLLVQESDAAESEAAKISFRQLSQWATYTADEARQAVMNAVFDGKSIESVTNEITVAITSAPNTIFGIKTVMGQLFVSVATQIINIRSVLTVMARMLVWLRYIAVRNR